MPYRKIACCKCLKSHDTIYKFTIKVDKKAVGEFYLCEEHRHLGAMLKAEIHLIPYQPKEDKPCHISQSNTQEAPGPTPSTLPETITK